MPNMAVGQRVLVTAVGEYYGQVTMTTWLYKVTVVAGTTTDTAFFAALDTIFNATGGLLLRYRGCCPANDVWLGRQTWYQVLGPLRFRKVQKPLSDGLYDSPSNTANIQASITRVGEFGTRRNIGGIRVPIPSFENVEGKITPDITIPLEALATEMALPVTAGSPAVTMVPQVGVPGYTNTVPPEQIPVTDSLDLSECIVQDTTRVIRRRTLRVGI